MSIFVFFEEQAIGEVRRVDASQVDVRVTSADKLLRIKAGRLVGIQGQDANEWLLGMVNKVGRGTTKIRDKNSEENSGVKNSIEPNTVQVTLIGTYRTRYRDEVNYFTPDVLSLPDINRPVFPAFSRTI